MKNETIDIFRGHYENISKKKDHYENKRKYNATFSWLTANSGTWKTDKTSVER